MKVETINEALTKAQKSEDPIEAKTATHLKDLIKELNWFYANGVKVKITPKKGANGWDIEMAKA